jgi:rhamnogalacturonan endolyase
MSRKNGTNAKNVSQLHLLGGTATTNRITLGYDATVDDGSATINVGGGTLYVGNGGIVRNGTGAFVSNVNLINGTLGAADDWSTIVPLTLAEANTVAIHAADSANLPHAITLGGPLVGSGGFTKTGDGTLTLASENTFTGSVVINSGTLLATGALAAGGEVIVNPGGTLAGDGTIEKSVVLNGGAIAPEGDALLSDVTWSAGSLLAVRLGTEGASDRLVLSGALNRGTAGSYPIALSLSETSTLGVAYTIATFASTNFTASDFTAVNLPTGYIASFTITGTSLQVTVRALASVALDETTQPYDGAPKPVTVVTTPQGITTSVTYNGSTTPPTLPGTYNVIATVTDPAYSGSATGTLTITITALVRHAPTLNGDIDGSIQVLLPESITLNGSAGVSGDLLVPGTPRVQLNGSPLYGGTEDFTGSASPTNHTITLNNSAVLRHVVRRVDAIAMPAVDSPQAPAGTRNVTINNPSQSVGNFATLRDLTLNSGAGAIAIPAGAYGAFAANGASSFVLGVAGATEPTIYHLQSLTLNSGARVQIVGPVILRVANSIAANSGEIGSLAHPGWLQLHIASGGVTLNSGAILHGHVTAPNGTVNLNSNTTINGHVATDRLTVNGSGMLIDPDL